MLKSLLQPKNLKFILLILIVLVILFVISKNQEGYVNFGYSINNNSSKVIKLYNPTRNLNKLFDGFYYDSNNSNVIVVNGTTSTATLTGSVENDLSENLISSLWVYDRNPSKSPEPLLQNTGSPVTQTSESSKKSGIESLNNEFTIRSPENTQLAYISWGQNTYMIALDGNGSDTNVKITGIFNYSGTVASSYLNSFDLSFSKAAVTNAYSDLNGNDGKLTKVNTYSKQTNVYQITNDAYYDYRNGNIILTTLNADNVVTYTHVLKRKESSGVYTKDNRDFSYNSAAPNDSERTEISSIQYSNTSTPYIVNPVQSKVSILVMPYQANTIVASFHMAPTEQQYGNEKSSNYYKLNTVGRFTTSGLAGTTSSNTSSTTDSSGSNTDSSRNNIDQTVLDAFTKWYMYWNNYYDKNNAENGYSDDYLLKTQIVPPVCPSCASCSGTSGTCTNCGGSGSGTGSSNLSDVKGPSSAVASLGQTAGSAYGQTLDTLKSAGSGATNLVRDVGEGAAVGALVAGGAVGAAGSQVYSDVRSAGSTVYGDVKGGIGTVAGGVGDVVSGIGSGVKSLFEPRFGYQQSYGGPTPQTVGQFGYVPTQNYMAQSGTYNQGRYDQYSYGGASPSKGSNFIPLTADFSAFSK